MRYPGGKGGSGVAQRIISLMPMHDRYVEPFLGGGIILRTKRPARSNIAADLDADVVGYHRRRIDVPNLKLFVKDAFELLPELELTDRDLVYLDPPYHPDTRTKKRIYRYELESWEHEILLKFCQESRAMLMISGYRCPMYDRMLWNWGRQDFRAMTRGGVRTESVWFNFVPGQTFHDTRYLGRDFRERERIKRKRIRWASRFAAMPPIEKAVIWESLEATMRTAATKALTSRE